MQRRLARLLPDARRPRWWYHPSGGEPREGDLGVGDLLEISGPPERTTTGRNRVTVILVTGSLRGWWGWAYVDEVDELQPLEALAVVEEIESDKILGSPGKSEEPRRSTGTSGASR